MKNILKISILSLGIVTATSCSNDFVEREFEQSVIQKDLTSVQEIQSFVRGAYVSMRASTYYGRDFLAYGEIRSDEMMSNGGSGYYNTVRLYNILSSDAYARDTYNQIYTMVGKTNIVINTDLSKVAGTAVDLAKAEYYQGQAYALRAQGFFDLLRLYGQKYTGGSLGIVTPTVYDPKAKQARSTIAETEAQIEADFNKALAMMTAKAAGNDNPANKTELSINALKSLMSRYYLYKGDYAKVRSLVSEIYGKYTVVGKELYQSSFSYEMRGSASNSIFELEVGTDSSLSTSSYNQIMSANGYKNLVVLPATYNLYDPADVRRSLLTVSGGVVYLSAQLTSGARGKYTNRTGADNIKMIRYEEVLLNGAEAELNGGDADKALAYYNAIVTNRGLDAKTSITLDDIKLERKLELLGEGFRQWDLLRWGNTSFKPANIPIEKLAFPIPRAETDIAGTLVVANPGYDN